MIYTIHLDLASYFFIVFCPYSKAAYADDLMIDLIKVYNLNYFQYFNFK